MSDRPSTSATAAPSAQTLEEKNFTIIEEIGTGAYGTVYKAKNVQTQDLVALKKIVVSHSGEEGMPLSTIREIAMLRQLGNRQHDNIVRLLDVVHGPKVGDTKVELNLVFEYIEQDLAMYLHRCPSPGLDKDRIKDLAQQLLTGVDFLHSNRIVHRDLKPQNILITGNNRLKIADFGLARIYGFNMALTQVVVTLWYRSPEVLLQKSYATPVDLWSVGCIFAELHTRRPLFNGKSDIDQLRTIFDVIGLPPRAEWPDDTSVEWTSFTFTRPRILRDMIYQLSPLAEDLLKSLLLFDPNQRISATNALNHSYFRDSDAESDDDEDNDDDDESEVDESEEEHEEDNQSKTPKAPELPRHESGSSMSTTASSSQQTQSGESQSQSSESQSQSQGSSLSID